MKTSQCPLLTDNYDILKDLWQSLWFSIQLSYQFETVSCREPQESLQGSREHLEFDLRLHLEPGHNRESTLVASTTSGE